MTTQYADPFDAMGDPQVRTGSADYFGSIKIDSYFAVLVKGAGKVPFDPAQHSADKRVTAIEMQMFPLAEMNIAWDVKRNCIAESREWAGTVLPSIKALGLTPREINNRWVHIVRKETGRTYTGSDGSSRPETTFEFVEAFANEAECRAAYQAYSAGAGSAPVAQPATATASAPANGKEKETAFKFLKVIVENAARGQSDLGVISATVGANIANMPMVAKYFTASSPETMNLIAEAMPK